MRPQFRARVPRAFSDSFESEMEEMLLSVFNGGLTSARVGRIPHHFAKAIGASTTIVRVTKSTMQKIRAKHPEIIFGDFVSLQSVFDNAPAERQGHLHLVFVYKAGPVARKVVVKATNEGKEIFLKTIHPISGYRLKAISRKGITVRAS